MELVPFRPEHLAGIDPPAMGPDQLAFFSRHYRPCGPAWTGIAAGRVVGCGGIVPDEDGGGTAWAILSHPVRAAAVHRAALRLLKHDSIPPRLAAAARADWPGACRWLERLGFRDLGIEGEYRRYVKCRQPCQRSLPV